MNKPGKLNYTSQVYIFSSLASIIVTALYIWFVSPSLEKPGTNYYSQLAIAFKRNQLYLPEQPSAALLSLGDPYDYTLRKDSNVEDFPWDVSLYNGKFYIYWGPVPALMLTGFSSNLLTHLGDQILVFAFMCGLFIYSALFTMSFWQRLNFNLPSWMIGPALLAIGLCAPATLILSNPKIYEAAIAGCQFFFIGGCYWAYRAIGGKDSPAPWKLALAGTHWALAFGTRVTILPVIIFIVAATLIHFLRENKTTNLINIPLSLSAMGTPLVATAIGLGWYNWARFGSIFEFGIQFQLASVNFNEFNNFFSIRYVYQNFLAYFLRPYQIQAAFPYIKTVENIVTNDRFSGLLYTSPYILFMFVPVGRILHSVLTSKKVDNTDQNKSSQENWLALVLTGSSLISLAIILLYFFTAMRFTEDFMPALLLLSTICFGRGYQLFIGNRKSINIYIFLAMLLVVFSITASTLLAIPGSSARSVHYFTQQIYELFGIR